MVTQYVPDRGDLIWLEFDPQAGKEQKGRRPALVLSPLIYNQKASLAICVPITSKRKGYPFEVDIKGKKIDGAILCDDVKSIDWKVRKAKFIEKISKKTLEDVLEIIGLLIFEK